MFVIFKKSLYEKEQKESNEKVWKARNEVVFLRAKLREKTDEAEKLKKSNDDLYAQAKADAGRKSTMAERIEHLIEELETVRKNTVIDSDIIPDEPLDGDARRQYVSQMSAYFVGGLSARLDVMVGNYKTQLSMFPLSERETDYYRACINVCLLLKEWGARLTGEYRANTGDDTTAFSQMED